MSYDPLLDSSNMDMADWGLIARDIEKNYQDFDGFVILHGTDTMCYTSAALSFMLENLGKTVIITGAQVRCRKFVCVYVCVCVCVHMHLLT